MKIYDNIEQGSPEWEFLRLGSIGGSRVQDVCAKGKTRATLMYRMAGELLSGQSYQGYTNAYMQRGIELEPAARALYEQKTGAGVRQVGLIRKAPFKHCSPDGLVGDLGMIEIKSVIPSTHVETISHGVIPSQYVKQIQWGLFITGRAWCDFVSYCPEIAARPIWIKRTLADVKLGKELNGEADKFLGELLSIVKTVMKGA